MPQTLANLLSGPQQPLNSCMVLMAEVCVVLMAEVCVVLMAQVSFTMCAHLCVYCPECVLCVLPLRERWGSRPFCNAGAPAPLQRPMEGCCRWVHPPPPHIAADTPEFPRSWADRVGIGTPRGVLVQVGAVPPLADTPKPLLAMGCRLGDRDCPMPVPVRGYGTGAARPPAESTPESPRSRYGRVAIGMRRAPRTIVRGPAACTIVARVQARVSYQLPGPAWRPAR